MDGHIGAGAINDPLAAVDAVHRHQALRPSKIDDPPPPPAAPPAYIAIADEASYKQLKEAWIADQTGSSIHLVNALGLVMLLTYAIWAVLRAKRVRFVQHRRTAGELANSILAGAAAALDRVSDWQLEFLILVVPAVCAHTVLANHLVATNGVLLAVLAFLLGTGPAISQKSPLAKKQRRHWSKKHSDDEDDGLDPRSSTDSHAESSRVAPRRSTEAELPFRVSIDSAADAAHASAAPPNFYDGPGSARSDNLLVDTSVSTAPQSPLLGSSSRSTDGSLLSPEVASTSSLPSPTKRPVELTALKTTPMQLLHSRDSSDAPSVSGSSAMLSPLARSVVDPWSKSRSVSHEQGSSDGTHSSPAPSPPATSAAAFVRPQPFLTVYRAHMMLVTVISILAVDFPVFPRALSKCESWGTSWMDMGVGSFVFSLGIISALPFLKSPSTRFRPLKQQLLSDFRKCLPLLLLGLVRVAMVKGVEYPEHVSEYGVHWNFFITLAVLPFAATLSRPVARYVRYSVLGVCLSVLHEVALVGSGWQEWALADIKRTTVVQQNKEGLTSIFGYLAIFYLGLDLGHYVLPLDPYFAYRRLRLRRSKPKTGKLAMILLSLTILEWAAYGAVDAAGVRVSRRLANLPYVLWVVAFNTSFLLGYVLVFWLVLQRGEVEASPVILEDLNRHSLTVFLAANVMTGLVNLSVKTMYTGDKMAVAILVVYVGACCVLARGLTVKGVRLKV